jgi:hypothetical protein
VSTTTQQIRPGLLFTRPIGGGSNTYKVLRGPNRRGSWTCGVVASWNLDFIGSEVNFSGREIQDAMSNANV